ncbi:MAG: endonuclease domain-containing protein [Phototrophicaceae bacterium]
MTSKKFAKTSPELWAKLKPLAKQMRHQPTPAENLLWQRLRRKALGVRFRRQHAINRFIVDFYAPKINLVIEVDGSIHDYTQEEDAIRQIFLEEVYGLTFLRFSNGDVIKNMTAVLSVIDETIHTLQGE